MAVFRSDPEVRIKRLHSLDRGDPYNLSTVAFGTHTGTHVDPPSHFVPGGTPIDKVDLEILNGPCRVVTVPDEATEVGPAEVALVPDDTARILFRTSNSARWEADDRFFPDYVALSPRAPEALFARGVRLVGIDSLSIERDPKGTFPVHRALLGRGTIILEGLRLARIPEGSYELRCLPLRIADGDGGPCRAALIAR